MRVQKRLTWLMPLLIVAILLSGGSGFCDTPKKVAVFPFTMNSSQDLGFLRNGLFSMLSSRLADPGKVEVMDRERVDKALAGVVGDFTEAKAKGIGASMGADYVLFGSLTQFGESVSLDARMVDVTGTKQTLAFFEQSNAMGDVIPLVNSFAGDINLKMFNRQINNELYVKPEAPQEPSAPGALHYAGGNTGIYGSGMIMQPRQGFATHLKMDDIIQAMAVGDVDNDGNKEVVTATDSSLLIYRLKGRTLSLVKRLDYASYLRIVGLDIADINGNGYPEIFVSTLTIQKDSLASFVVEYNGKSYMTLCDDQAVYYGVITQQGHPVLLTQDKKSDPFAGSIYITTPRGNEYIQEKRMRFPRYTSVISLAHGSVSAEDTDEYLSVNRHNRLVLIDSAGSSTWESTEKFGKSNKVWLMPKSGTDSSYRERIYFNPRIQFHAVGEDRKPMAFVVKNEEIGGGSFGQYKRFKDGFIQVLSWNGIAMAPVFQTAPVQGWISDFTVTDLDGDGNEELVVAIVSRSKIALLAKDTGSNIISYPLK